MSRPDPFLDPFLLTSHQAAKARTSIDDPQHKSANNADAKPSAEDQQQRPSEIARQWWDNGSRQDWQNRSFNHAELSGSLMARANLQHASLQGANLFGAQLQGADLSSWRSCRGQTFPGRSCRAVGAPN